MIPILNIAQICDFANIIARKIDNYCEVNDTITVGYNNLDAVVRYTANTETFEDGGWRTSNERVEVIELICYEDFTKEQVKHLQSQLNSLLN